MANTIDLAKRAELRARATGQVPPPAAPAPGVAPPASAPNIRGTLPLPAGTPVNIGTTMHIEGSDRRLTPMERQTLLGLGWDPNTPIPPDMAKRLTQARLDAASKVAKSQAHAAELPLPVPVDMAPIEDNTVNIENLPPERRREILQNIQTAFAKDKAVQEAAEAERQSLIGIQDPAMRLAIKQAEQVAASTSPAGITLVNDLRNRPAPAPAGPIPPPPPAPAAPVAPPAAADPAVEAPPATTGETMAHTPAFCPHCNWDLGVQDVPEPPHGEKIAFLHATLGMKPYVRRTELFAGELIVAFRTLSTKEMDLIFDHVAFMRDTGKIKTELDHWEVSNRFRFYSQLVSLRSRDGIINLDFPDSLTPSPSAWVFPPSERADGRPDLTHMETYMNEEVLKTESLHRVLQIECGRFNRLVAKMEALVDNADFWQRTEGQS